MTTGLLIPTRSISRPRARLWDYGRAGGRARARMCVLPLES